MEQRKLERIFQKGRCKWRRRAFHPFETSRFLLSNRRGAGLEPRETLYQAEPSCISSMRKQKGSIPEEVLFGELVHLSHQIRSVGGPQGDTSNDTPRACSGAGAEPLASTMRLQ